MTVGPDGDFRPKKETYRLKRQRDRAYRAWSAAYDQKELHWSPATEREEQDAWEHYLDICGDLHECSHYGCEAYSPDHVYCETHRE